MGRVGHEKDLLIYVFPVVEQEFCQISLVVWALSRDIHVRGNIGSLACAYVRIYDCCTISRCIIDMTGEVLAEESGLWQVGEIWPVRVPKFEKVVDEFCRFQLLIVEYTAGKILFLIARLLKVL